MRSISIAAVVVAILGVHSAGAATYVVRPDGTGDFPTIQAAIDAAVDGDVVELTDGTFTGAGNRDIDFRGKVITVQSRSGDPEACVIDCRGSASDRHRGILFIQGEGPATVVAGLTIANGYVLDHGGAIYALRASPSLRDCIFRDCQAPHGGGVCMLQCVVSITDCTFRGNTAYEDPYGNGGGFDAFQCTGEIVGCIFEDNRGGYGGGALLCGSTGPTFHRCTFLRNIADVGGAIHL